MPGGPPFAGRHRALRHRMGEAPSRGRSGAGRARTICSRRCWDGQSSATGSCTSPTAATSTTSGSSSCCDAAARRSTASTPAAIRPARMPPSGRRSRSRAASSRSTSTSTRRRSTRRAKGEPPATDHVVGRIRYRATPTGSGEVTCDAGESSGDVGHIVYCRAAVTADAPFDVRAFQAKDPRFPHHSTLRPAVRRREVRVLPRARRAHRGPRRRHAAPPRAARRAPPGARRTGTPADDDPPARPDRRGPRRACARCTSVAALGLADRRLFRSLLDEIAVAENDARRPSLSLVVQERARARPELKAQLQQVWDYYWTPQVAASGNGATPAAG